MFGLLFALNLLILLHTKFGTFQRVTIIALSELTRNWAIRVFITLTSVKDRIALQEKLKRSTLALLSIFYIEA